MGRVHSRRRGRSLLLLVASWSLAACSQAGGEPGSTNGPDPAAPAATSVTVSVDRERYEVGERVGVTIRNGLADPIFAPPPGPCSIVSLSRLEGGRWRNVDTCPAFDVYVTEIAGMGQLTGVLGPASQPPVASGPIVIDPVSPHGSGGPLSALPTVAPWRSGDPVRVVPEGEIAPPFSAAEAELESGTYRAEFSYSQGSTSGPVSTSYSEPFIVAD